MSVRPPLRLHDRDGQGFPNFEFFGFDYQMPSIERPKVQVRRRRRRSRDNLKDNLNPVGCIFDHASLFVTPKGLLQQYRHFSELARSWTRVRNTPISGHRRSWKRREFLAATAALLRLATGFAGPRYASPDCMLWHFGKCANCSRRVAQWLARKRLDRGQEPARRISLYPTHRSLSSFGSRVEGSQPRSGSCRRAIRSLRPEIGNRYHSDCVRRCGRSRGAWPRPKSRPPRRQHNGPCDRRTRISQKI